MENILVYFNAPNGDFFYKNVTDKVFEVLEELGIWLCHNGGNETIWVARDGIFQEILNHPNEVIQATSYY